MIVWRYDLLGTVDMTGVHRSVNKQSDGSDYLALTLPSPVIYSNVDFESLNVQTAPDAPIIKRLGRFNINGSISMQGQPRI